MSHHQILMLMLLNDFYTIETADSETAGIEPLAPLAVVKRAVLALNATHPIFAGHFPGQPVVPGACQLQMVQELLTHVLGSEYRLRQAGQLKFLTPIDPRQHPRIEATLRYAPTRPDDPLQVTATLSAGGTIFLKFTGTFAAG